MQAANLIGSVLIVHAYLLVAKPATELAQPPCAWFAGCITCSASRSSIRATQAVCCQRNRAAVQKVCNRSAMGQQKAKPKKCHIAHDRQNISSSNKAWDVSFVRRASELLTFCCVTHADAATCKLNLLSAKQEDTIDELKHAIRGNSNVAFLQHPERHLIPWCLSSSVVASRKADRTSSLPIAEMA